MRPNTRFTWSDGFAIAYQVVGDGVRDLVYLPGFASNVHVSWDVPPIARFLEGLASFSRLILLDRRGVGCSDRCSPGTSPPLEECAADVLAAMDAVGSRSATLVAVQDSVFIALAIAATAPKRVGSLVLFGGAASWLQNEDMPWEASAEWWAEQIADDSDVESAFEQADGYARRNLPSEAGDPDFVERFASLMLANQAPSAWTAEAERWSQVDVREILPTIQAPTLVLHRTGDPVESIESGRHLAQHIPGARLVELEGSDAQPWAGDARAVLTEIEAFVTGTPPRPADRPDVDRMLATILFTDIVGSTERAAELGDATWREVVVEHETRTREVLQLHAGVFDHTTGDGVMARFDGPARAVRCAREIGASVHDLGITVRAGLHTGEIELTENGAHGLAVHLAARVAALAGPNEVWVSSTVKDLTAGSGLTFEDAGEHELKGVPDTWHLYRVVS